MNKPVITGMGVVTPIGIGIDNYWHNLIQGKCGIGRITRFDASSLPVNIAAEITNFQSELPKNLLRSASLFMQFAFAAATEALLQAGILPIARPERAGICMATALAGIPEICTRSQEFYASNTGKVSPHFIPRIMANMACAHLAIHFGLKGPGLTLSTACSAGGDAMLTAAMLLREGDADFILVMGAESILAGPVVSSLAQAKALSRANDKPGQASRPFDKERDGFVVGEGAGAIILETRQHAVSRNAKILATLSGWANTMDGWHITAPEPQGEGAARCMRLALNRAGLRPEDIDYINAHGTGTILGDTAETIALKTVFGDNVPPVSSTKGATGHLMGAGGLTEAITCVLAMTHNLIPPTLNLETPDPDCDLDYVPLTARNARINTAMSNSLGFGGQNSSIILKKSN